MNRAPDVVALGGGHGLANTLRAARTYGGRVTAVVSTADDGGSSGVLRRAFGTVPPGDLRKCLVALGDPASVWARAFEHRFGAEAGEAGEAGEARAGVEGHALGNLVIAGLTDVLGGLQAALDEAMRLLGAVGRVLPATEEPVVLSARTTDRLVEGQAAVSRSGRIAHIAISPADPAVPAAVIDAILAADQILLGPGSLYTSVLAVATVPAIADVLKKASGRSVYICNLRPQIPETEGLDVAAHLRALRDHGVEADVLVCDSICLPRGVITGVEVVDAPLAGSGGAHDPALLAGVLRGLVGG